MLWAGPGRLSTHTPVTLNTLAPFANGPQEDDKANLGEEGEDEQWVKAAQEIEEQGWKEH